MDTVTYPNDEVAQLLHDRFVCFKPQMDRHQELAQRYGVLWTPGMLWLDERGTKRHSNVGFFEPREFLAECTYGAGKVAGGRKDWKTALQCFDEVQQRWPDSFAAPAAMYWGAVAAKFATGKTDELLRRWRELLSGHPGSAWAMKISFLNDQDGH
jgi:TolA-binding protein